MDEERLRAIEELIGYGLTQFGWPVLKELAEEIRLLQTMVFSDFKDSNGESITYQSLWKAAKDENVRLNTKVGSVMEQRGQLQERVKEWIFDGAIPRHKTAYKKALQIVKALHKSYRDKTEAELFSLRTQIETAPLIEVRFPSHQETIKWMGATVPKGKYQLIKLEEENDQS